MSKEIGELNLPDDMKYTDDHEWTRLEGGNFKIGITDYAQDQLGEIVFVELPEAGDIFEKKEEFGTLESVKAVSEIYMPVAGEIVAVNEELGDEPQWVNEDPYGKGWFVEIKPADPADLTSLMDKEGYLDMLKGLES